MPSKSLTGSKQKESLIIARGQDALGRNNDQIKAFLLNHGVAEETVNLVCLQLEKERKMARTKRIALSITFIIGAPLLAAVVALCATLMAASGYIWIGAIFFVPFLIGMEVSGIIGLAGALKRRY